MLDLLIVAPSSAGLYQELKNDFSAKEPNIWAGMLANAVRNDHSVKIVDLEIVDPSVLFNTVETETPRLILFVVTGQNPNASTAAMAGAVEAAEEIYKFGANSPIAFVGPHVNALPLETLKKHHYIDIVFTNEGVYALKNVLSSDLNHDLHDIKGIAYRDKKGEIRINPFERIVPQERLSIDLPGCGYDLMPTLSNYRTSAWHSNYAPVEERSPFASIYTSLGCIYKCLHGDTLVNTIYGKKPIKELAEKYDTIPVYTYDFEKDKICIADAVNIQKTGSSQKLVRVEFDDGTYIDCTPDHKFICFKNGNQNAKTKHWISEAKDIKPNTSVKVLKEINHKVVSVYEIDGEHDTYCMKVPGYGWFYANNVLVKNCEFCMINIINRTGEENYSSAYNKFRYWEPSFIINEFDYLAKQGVKHVKVADEMWVLKPKHFMDLCDLLIDRDYGFNIWAYSRIDTVKPHYLEKLKAAGVNWLALGIEAGNQEIRREITKGKFEDINIREVVKMIQDAGINVCANYIFGLGHDTYDTMQETLNLAYELNAETTNIYCATSLPGSPLYNKAISEGWELPQEYSEFGFLSYDHVPSRTYSLGAAQVLEFRDYAFHALFENPRFLNMVNDKFGSKAVKTIEEMTSIRLKRKMLDEKN